MGRIKRSERIKPMQTKKDTETSMDPAGIVKCGPRRRSMVRAWRTKRLVWMPIGVPKKMEEDQSGKILMSVLRSSTCWRVQRFHGFAIEPSVELISPWAISAARFRNLHHCSLHFWLISCINAMIIVNVYSLRLVLPIEIFGQRFPRRYI